MDWRQRPFHPILFGLFPALSLYSLNTGLVPIGDVPIPLLVILGCACIFWGILSAVLRSIPRGAAGASVATVLFFAYSHMWEVVRARPRWSREFGYSRTNFLWFWAPIFVVGVVLACWKWKKQERVTYAFNVGGVLLAAAPLISILTSWASAWRGTTVANSTSNVALKVTERPDIFYVILDGYGRNDSLKRAIGYSDDLFISGLKDRGFFIAKNSRSNYCQTELSLSSSLNLDYLQKLLPNLKANSDDRTIFDRLIDENQVSRYLKKLGYRYEAITTGFPSVHPDSADAWLQEAQGISLYAGFLLDETPIPPKELVVQSQFEVRRTQLKAAFRNLGDAGSGGMVPRFVFAHILAPHPPFVFDENGASIQPKGMGFTIVDASDFMLYGGTPQQYATGYKNQAIYISKLMLHAVDKILKSSGSHRPIIILQGDHGSKKGMDQQLLEKTDVNECFPNLNAYLVPESVKPNLYDEITPVNSFRMIFNGLFGDKFERLPDESYYSGWLTPFQFVNVSNRIKPSRE